MLTIDNLREYGANVEEGLSRCVNNEEFYLRLVGKVINDAGFSELREAVAANDLDKAFDAAHKLKGAVGNLALTPLCEPINEMVELLRSRSEADYPHYLEVIEEKKKLLEDLL